MISGWGTQIVRDMCFLGRGTHIPRVMSSAFHEVTAFLLSGFYITHAWRFFSQLLLRLDCKERNLITRVCSRYHLKLMQCTSVRARAV